MNPHTLIFDKTRTLWFTVQKGVVRHMVATPQGDIYIACSGVGKVGVVRVEK